MAINGTAAAGNERPAMIRCKMDFVMGCSDEGICISDAINDLSPITFDLKANRYSSSKGRGHIDMQWNKDDGRLAINVSAPPATGEFVFSSDWKNGYADSSIVYACEILRR